MQNLYRHGDGAVYVKSENKINICFATPRIYK